MTLAVGAPDGHFAIAFMETLAEELELPVCRLPFREWIFEDQVVIECPDGSRQQVSSTHTFLPEQSVGYMILVLDYEGEFGRSMAAEPAVSGQVVRKLRERLGDSRGICAVVTFDLPEEAKCPATFTRFVRLSGGTPETVQVETWKRCAPWLAVSGDELRRFCENHPLAPAAIEVAAHFAVARHVLSGGDGKFTFAFLSEMVARDCALEEERCLRR